MSKINKVFHYRKSIDNRQGRAHNYILRIIIGI